VNNLRKKSPHATKNIDVMIYAIRSQVPVAAGNSIRLIIIISRTVVVGKWYPTVRVPAVEIRSTLTHLMEPAAKVRSTPPRRSVPVAGENGM